VNKLGTHIPLHFSAFYPAYKLLDIPTTSLFTLQFARKIAQKAGIKYVFIGNKEDKEGSSTICSKCKKVLIERSYYKMLTYNLDSFGKCKFCGHVCEGKFDDKVGTWGAKRIPINIENEDS